MLYILHAVHSLGSIDKTLFLTNILKFWWSMSSAAIFPLGFLSHFIIQRSQKFEPKTFEKSNRDWEGMGPVISSSISSKLTKKKKNYGNLLQMEYETVIIRLVDVTHTAHWPERKLNDDCQSRLDILLSVTQYCFNIHWILWMIW